jgi:hypothetical protein
MVQGVDSGCSHEIKSRPMLRKMKFKRFLSGDLIVSREGRYKEELEGM